MSTFQPCDDPVRKNIEALEFDAPDARFTFTQRLARENGWTPAFAARAVFEYKRFLILAHLAGIAGHAVTPSDQVDQVWHLHLTYTRHYWDNLCGEILLRPLHHGPTRGGLLEDRRYLDQYEYTLNQYRKIFGDRPPSDVWPETGDRFGGRPIRIDRVSYWILPKPNWLRGIVRATSRKVLPVRRRAASAGALLLGLFGFTGIAVAADYSLFGITLSERTWTGLIFLGFIGFVCWVIYRSRSDKGPGGRGGPGGCGAGCGGGGCGS